MIRDQKTQSIATTSWGRAVTADEVKIQRQRCLTLCDDHTALVRLLIIGNIASTMIMIMHPDTCLEGQATKKLLHQHIQNRDIYKHCRILLYVLFMISSLLNLHYA